MSAPRRRESRDLVQAAEALGYSLDRVTGSGHFRFRHASGAIVIIATRTSSHRNQRNNLAELRRHARKEPHEHHR